MEIFSYDSHVYDYQKKNKEILENIVKNSITLDQCEY